MHRITIEKAVNGIIVKIGCVLFVAEDIAKGMDWLTKYLLEPESTEKWWCEKYPELEQCLPDVRQYEQATLLGESITPIGR